VGFRFVCEIGGDEEVGDFLFFGGVFGVRCRIATKAKSFVGIVAGMS